MNFIEYMTMPKGYLEIVVTNHYTGELIRRDPGHNQVQDWARHALAYIYGGRLFCTLGNHGEAVTDIGAPFTIPHVADGSNTVISATPWTYSSAMAGLIQKRALTGDLAGQTATVGDPLYPFFPTKMRFGVGGLDVDQNPRVDVLTSATRLQNTQSTFPFVVVDRQAAGNENDHIFLSQTTLGVNHAVTFSCKLPGGGGNAYDGYVLSEAGLFCDAALVTPGNNYDMRTGCMLAFRTFYGITKNESIDVTFNWKFVF